MEVSWGSRGPAWALALGCVALALAAVLAVDSCSYVGRTGAAEVGYVGVALGTPLLAVLFLRTYLAWQLDRPIWPVEWSWVVLVAGIVAIAFAGSVAAHNADDAKRGYSPELVPR